MPRTKYRGTRKGSPVRILPRIPGISRQQVGARVDAAIERALSREMARYGVSRSFVIRNALAYTFGIELGKLDDYTDRRPNHDHHSQRRR